jgi:hypothetical protein
VGALVSQLISWSYGYANLAIPQSQPSVLALRNERGVTSIIMSSIVDDYSHSAVFTTAVGVSTNIFPGAGPPLLSIYTPRAECAQRWMLADDDYNSFGGTFSATKLRISSGLTQLSTGIPRLTVWSISRDKLYAGCQPYSSSYWLYSPGVCPSGHTAAEITEFHYAEHTNGGSLTAWQASCCRR